MEHSCTVQGVERVGSIDQECSLCVAAVKVATQGMCSGLRPPPLLPCTGYYYYYSQFMADMVSTNIMKEGYHPWNKRTSRQKCTRKIWEVK